MSVKVTNSLRQALAETYVLLVKSHNYHWNVTGIHFVSLHTLFEEHYNDLFVAADELAERLRSLREPAPGTMAKFLEISQIKEGSADTVEQMVEDLRTSHAHLAATCQSGIEAAEDASDQGTADLLTARKQFHDKAEWMLRMLGMDSGLAHRTEAAKPAAKEAPKPAPKAKPAPAKAKPAAAKPKAKPAPKAAPQEAPKAAGKRRRSTG